MASKFYAQVARTRCVSCGACTHECPRDAIRVWKGCFALVDPLRCIGCGKCKKACPADCIDMKLREADA
ncbi:MAG: 4Fe-4S binding protein [Oscillospiraceae bacterium]|nr:4Fe-4S binding protein [Oscillospiraceae bacterium]